MGKTGFQSNLVLQSECTGFSGVILLFISMRKGNVSVHLVYFALHKNHEGIVPVHKVVI